MALIFNKSICGFTALFAALLHAGIVHAGGSSPGLVLNTSTAPSIPAGGSCATSQFPGNPYASNASTCTLSATAGSVSVGAANIQPSLPNLNLAPALYIFGNGSAINTLSVSGNITGYGTSAVQINKSGASSFTLNLAGGTVTGSGNSPMVAINSAGTVTINNSGDITALGGGARAVSVENGNTATVNFNHLSGTVSGGAGAAAVSNPLRLLLKSTPNPYDFNVNISGGTIQTSGAAAIQMTNQPATHNSITVSGGTVQSTGTAANGVVDVSNTTSSGGTQIAVSGGSVTQASGATGVAIKIGNAADTVAVSGGSISGQIITSANGNGVVSFNAPTAFTTGGNVGSAAARLASVSVTGGALNIANDLYANAITLSGNSSSVATTGVTLGGNTAMSGTASLNTGINTVAVTGLFDTSAGTPSIKTSAVGNGTAFTSNGKITATTLSMSGNERLVVNMTGGVADGAKFKLIDAASGSGAKTLQAGNVTTDSATLKFKALSGNDGGTVLNAAPGVAGEDLWVTAEFATVAPFSMPGANYVDAGNVNRQSPAAPAGDALSAIANSKTATAAILGVVNTFNTFSAAQLNNQVQKLAPVANNAHSEISFEVIENGLNDAGARLDSLRGGSVASAPRTGLSAGDDAKNKSAWIKTLGVQSRQNAQGVFDGYKADSLGVSLGADTDLGNDVRAGAAFGYASSNVKQQDFRQGDSTRIKSYQLTGYGSKNVGPAYFDGLITYSRHSYDAQRAAALGQTAQGSWTGNQFGARIASGYRLPMGPVTLVPVASLEWLRLHQNAYTESGAGALSLQVNDQANSRVKSSIGARVLGDYDLGSTSIKPEAHLFWVHDFRDRNTAVTSSFTGAGAAFTTQGAPLPRNGYDIGVGLTAQAGKHSTVKFAYNYEGRSGFSQHALSLTARWNF